jgi:hypothetical protein
VAAIGETTAAALREAGLPAGAVARKPEAEALAEALAEAMAQAPARSADPAEGLLPGAPGSEGR